MTVKQNSSEALILSLEWSCHKITVLSLYYNPSVWSDTCMLNLGFRAWAEDEAKRVREHAEALERARDRWEGYGIKVVVDDDIRDREEASAGVTLPDAEDQFSIQGTVDRADNLLDKLKIMAADVRGKTRDTIDKIIHVISQLMSRLREWAEKAGKQAEELREVAILKAGKSAYEVQQSAHEFGFAVKEGAKRVVGDCREGVEKLTQKFKT